MIMPLKYIQEGLSLGFKVHDTVLRLEISRLSMHVPDGVLTDMMGIGLLFWVGGWAACICVFAGRLGWGGAGGITFVLVPLGIQKAVCLALGISAGGRYDVELVKVR